MGPQQHQQCTRYHGCSVGVAFVAAMIVFIAAQQQVQQHDTSLPLQQQLLRIEQQQLPIFVLSLAKSGTTSIHKFFQCGGRSKNKNAALPQYRSVHHRYPRTWYERLLTTLLQRDQGKLIGKCLAQENWTGCTTSSRYDDSAAGAGFESEYNVFSDLSYTIAATSNSNKGTSSTIKATTSRSSSMECFFPSVTALPQLYNAHPNATWILTLREDPRVWYHSLKSFLGGQVLQKWNACWRDGDKDDSHSESRSSASTYHKDEQEEALFWMDFYQQHTARIDKFVAMHPSIRYVKVSLSDNDSSNTKKVAAVAAARLLSSTFGVPETCWGQHRKSRHLWNRLIDAMETLCLRAFALDTWFH